MKKQSKTPIFIGITIAIVTGVLCYISIPSKNGDYAGAGMHYWKHRNGRVYIGIGAPPWAFTESIDQWMPNEEIKAEKTNE